MGLEIHELNTFEGTPGANDYLATDNGNETKKISAEQLLAAVNAALQQMGVDLNGRIDNIIAGGAAPSASEIIDARRGGNDIDYASLGAAIRGQYSDLKSDINNINNLHDLVANSWEQGGLNGGQETVNPARIRSVQYIPFMSGSKLTINITSGFKYEVTLYTAEKVALSESGWVTEDKVWTSTSDGYARIALARTDDSNITPTESTNISVKYSSPIVDTVLGNESDIAEILRNFKMDRLNGAIFEQNGLENGTGQEYDSEYYVRSFYIAVEPSMILEVANHTDSAFWYSIHQYNANKTWISALTLVNYQTKSTFTLDANCYYIRVELMRNAWSGTIVPNDVDSSIINFKWMRNTTTLFREPFIYLGDSGRFVFKDDNIFDSAGRCAWRISTDDLCLKLPNKSLIEFTNAQIISALTSDDLYVDGGTTWIYLRPGRALVYNDATSSLESVEINYNTPLGDRMYPLLMMWSLQAVGGMLFEKFLFDVQTVKINQAVSGSVASITATEINNARHIAGDTATPLTLLHFSDPHADTDAINRILSDAGNYSASIDEMICTGDMVANTAGQIASWWNPDVLTCIGNHDSASYNSSTGYDWTALSMADRDAYYIAPFESNWGVTHTTGTSYYYKDYATQKVRLIVMDAMLYTNNGAEATAQTAWLASLLADAISNNLHVLIAIHSVHGGATPIECSFSKYGEVTMPTQADCNTPQVVIDAVATAISNGLKFIGYIVGHTHQDNMWDAENDGTQLMYCITCAAVSQRAQWINSDQNRSITEDAYNLVTIDTAHTLVKIIRGGGANIDDHMRTRKAICFNYSTGQMVGEVL